MTSHAPAPVEIAFGARRELRPLHDEVGAAACSAMPSAWAAFSTGIDQQRAHGIGHRRRAPRRPGPKKLFSRAKVRSTNWSTSTKWPGASSSLQRSAGRDRNQIGDARALQGVDVGAVVDGGRRHWMAAAVARQEADRQAVDLRKQDVVRGRAPRRHDLFPTGVLEAPAGCRSRCRR